MNALVLSVSLLDRFVHGFTAPCFGHFTYFVLSQVALLWEYQGGHWVGFPLAALLFVPLARCSAPWPFLSKIELAERLLRSLRWPTSRLIVVVDNLYAKAQLARVEVNHHRCVLLSRLRSNAALYLVPPRLAKPRR